MGFRFSKRIKILPGVHLNLGLKGASVSIGPRGAAVTIGKRGVHGHVGLPGTGLSYRRRLDAPTRAAPSPRPRPEPRPIPPDPKIRFEEDGSISLLGPNGYPLDEEVATAVRSAHRAEIVDMLEARAEQRNAAAEALDVHLLAPRPQPGSGITPFDDPKPDKPAVPRERAEELWSDYMERLGHWRAAKAEHARAHGLFPGSEKDVEAAIARRIETLEWPRETLVSLEVTDGGLVVEADVDLPEIEDLPTIIWTVNRRALRLDAKPLTDIARRRLYLRHVHAILFRIIAEVFRASALPHQVRIPGYTQRVSTGSGRVEDEYILAVAVTRDAWRGIDFANLSAVDPADALARFDRTAAIDGRAQMRPIPSPFA